jgi:hypothetical protein
MIVRNNKRADLILSFVSDLMRIKRVRVLKADFIPYVYHTRAMIQYIGMMQCKCLHAAFRMRIVTSKQSNQICF